MSTVTRLSRYVYSIPASLRDAARYVSELPALGTTILLGGLLWAYSIWLVIPGVLVMGYLLRILRHVPSGPEEPDVTPVPEDPPRFDDWARLLADGVRGYVVWTGYWLVAFGGGISFLGTETSEKLLMTLLGFLLGNVSFVLDFRNYVNPEVVESSAFGLDTLYQPAILLFVVSMYVAPAALLNLAARGKLSSAFAFEEIKAILSSPAYVRHWIVFVVLWVVSTAVLLFPGDWAATTYLPNEPRMLPELAREAIELLRGIVSFALLVFGYAVLGRVPVPPTDRPSVRRYLRALFGSRLETQVADARDFAPTVLVASLLAAFWSIPAVVLLAGYLVRFVRATGAGSPPPRFDDWKQLIVDGLRAGGAWLLLAFPAIAVLHAWMLAAFPNGYLLTALTGIPGVVLGAWYQGRDLFNLLAEVSPIGEALAGVDPTTLLSVAVVLAVGATFLYPAVIVGLAADRGLLRSLSPLWLARETLRPAYLLAWVRALVLVLVGGALSLAWNWWRFPIPGNDTTALYTVGQFPLVSVPTNVGVTSSLLLYLASLAGVLLLLRAYAGIAAASGSLDRPEAASGQRSTGQTPDTEAGGR